METIENNNIQHKLKPRRSRACFTHHQLLELERRFSIQRYLQSLNITVSRIGKSHMKTGFFQLWFLKKKIWSKYTLGIVVSWYNLRNCNIWLFLWHLSPQSGPFHQFWSFLLILFSKTTQKKSKHYSGRAFLEVFGKCVGLGLSSSIQRPQKC